MCFMFWFKRFIPVFGNTEQLIGTEDLKEAVCHSLVFHRELGDIKKLSSFRKSETSIKVASL